MSRAPSTSAMTLAASVLPTPASPSMNSGFRIFRLGGLFPRIIYSLGADRGRSDVGQADAPITVHLLGRGADDRPVEQAAAELDVLVRAIRHREDDLGDYLVRTERSGEQVFEEILGSDRATVGDALGVEHECDGGIVTSRVG